MIDSKHEVVRIIMRRDGLSVNDAIEAVQQTAMNMQRAIYDGDYMEAEGILADELGLEPDYLMSMVDF